MAATLLIALLSFLPHSRFTPRVNARFAQIAADADAASAHAGTPVGLLLAVGWMESHLGTAEGSGACWGAPLDVRHRHTAGTPEHAARALARSYVVCGTWARAVSRFRSGQCAAPAHAGYVRTAVALAERTYRVAGVPAPALR